MDNIFGVKKPVIGMLHLDDLLGTPLYKGQSYLVDRAEKDIQALQRGGIDGILIENWKEDSVDEFVLPQTAISMAAVIGEIIKFIKVPYGINVLNNDYKVAYALAAVSGAAFVQLDVLVDEVESDFSYSQTAKKAPFQIKVDQQEVKRYAKLMGMENLPLFCFVQPKHYRMLEVNKTIEQSVKEAEEFGATGVLVTKATGVAPTLDLIGKARSAAEKMAVGIGSGFSVDNAKEFLEAADFAVVGSSIKFGGVADNMVEEQKVRELMKIVNGCRMGG